MPAVGHSLEMFKFSSLKAPFYVLLSFVTKTFAVCVAALSVTYNQPRVERRLEPYKAYRVKGCPVTISVLANAL